MVPSSFVRPSATTADVNNLRVQEFSATRNPPGTYPPSGPLNFTVRQLPPASAACYLADARRAGHCRQASSMQLPSVQFQIIAPIFQNGIALLGVSTLHMQPFACPQTNNADQRGFVDRS